MKKFLSVLLAVVLCVSVMACASTETETTETINPTDEPTVEEAPAEETAAATTEDDIKIGLISGLTGFGDLSMNDQAMTGCEMCVADYGVTYKAVEPKDTTQVLDMIQSFVKEGYQIIILAVPDYDDILAEIAPQYPDTQFMTIDSTMSMDNVMAVEYLTYQGSYLAGAAAAMVSTTGTVGAVGGMDLTAISRFIDAYFQGAQSINPDIKTIVKYVGTDYNAWADTATAKSITLDMIDNGCDVVFQVAGGAGLGTIEACKERGVWAIGVNSDQEYIAPDTVLTSMLTVGENAIYEAVGAYVSDRTPFTGVFEANLENGCVDIVYSSHFTDEQIVQLQDIRAKIISGEIEVYDAVNP